MDWHYPRTDLARQYLDELESGLAHTIVLVAPRRTGKTEFVQRDMLPMSREAGWITVTVDFWADLKDPERCLYRGFKEAFDALPRKWKLAAGQWSKGSFKIGGPGIASISGEKTEPPLHALDELWSVFKRLMENHNQNVLLHLDEVQHLATQESFVTVTAALRTYLDKNKSWLRSIMTGSSQDDLQRLFRRSKAPFFQAVELRQYESLGASFVKHQIACYQLLVGKRLSERDAVQFFKSINRRPDIFQAVIKDMVKIKVTDFDDAWAVLKPKYDSGKDIEEQWTELRDIDSAVAQLLAEKCLNRHDSGPYSPEAFKRIIALGNLDKQHVTKSTVQNSLQRLRKMGWIANVGHGEWAFESEDILRWIESNALDQHN